MQYREVCRVLGKFLLLYSLILVIPFIIALYYHFFSQQLQGDSSLAFLKSILACLIFSGIFSFIGQRTKGTLYRRESIFLVVLIWIVASLMSALPFYFSNTLNFLDSCFESVSGLTSTGASMMYPKAYDTNNKEIPIKITNPHVPDVSYTFYGTVTPVRDNKDGKIISEGVEAVSKDLLFWRSFIQWLGGMGIVVLLLAVLPALAIGGKFLYQAEIPGPTKDTFVPRIKETASILWKIYLLLTVIQVYLLIWTNSKMPLLDAFCISFSSLSCGGFSVRNASIAAYQNIWTEWIVIIFMFIGSVNFAIYFNLFKGKLSTLKDRDFLFFVFTVIVGVFFTVYPLIGSSQHLANGTTQPYPISSAIRDGAFQLISAQSTTGFVTQNYDLWPYSSQIIILMYMFVGGMASSTAGGIKTSRFFILAQIIKNRLNAIFKPDQVKTLKVGNIEVSDSISITILAFFTLFIVISVLSIIILVFSGIDPETSTSIIACMINDVGMAFRAAGPDGSFCILSSFGKILSIFLMILGRLEIFAVLLLFLPRFWKE
jgi:trk system potassium uptake protein TrkH